MIGDMDEIIRKLEEKGIPREEAESVLKQMADTGSALLLEGRYCELPEWTGNEKFVMSQMETAKELIKRDGKLSPVLFLVSRKMTPIRLMILPVDRFMEKEATKEVLAQFVRKMAKDLKLTEICMVTEAWVKHIDETEPLFELVKNGILRVSDLSSRKEAIVVQLFMETGETQCLVDMIHRDENKAVVGFKNKNSSFKDKNYRTSSRFNPWQKDVDV